MTYVCKQCQANFKIICNLPPAVATCEASDEHGGDTTVSGTTASTPFEDPNTQKVQKNAIYQDKRNTCKILRSFPLSSYKTTLKQQLNGEQ